MGKISMPQGKGNLMHNRRDYEEMPEHIDESRMSQNVTVVDRDIREVYEELFGESVREFNARQTHADRRIEDYHDHIAHSKQTKGQKQVFYEDVVQWGKMDDFKVPETRQTAKEALLAYANSFEERNPNLKLVGAYIHMDEASPHLHLDYVPVGHYSRGLKTKNALDRAMKEMGIEPRGEGKIGNATQVWKEREREYFAGICRDMGLKVDAEEQSTRKNLSVSEYKEARDRMRQIAKQSVKQEMTKLKYTEKQKINKQWDVLKDAQTALDARQSDLNALDAQLRNQRAKLLKTQNTLSDKAKSLSAKEKALNDRETALDTRETALDARQSDLTALDTQLRNQQAKLLKTQNTLSERATALDERAKALDNRETALDARDKHQKTTQIDIKRQQQDLTKRENKAIMVDKSLRHKHKEILTSTARLEHIKADNQQVLDGVTSATTALRELMDKGLRLTASQKRDLHDRLERHKPVTPTTAPALAQDIREFMDGLDSLGQDKGGLSL